MRGNRCEVYINDVKSKLFPLGSSGCRSNLPAALFGMTVSINEAGKEKENITKQRDSKKLRIDGLGDKFAILCMACIKDRVTVQRSKFS